jgi:hypothetical protein
VHVSAEVVEFATRSVRTALADVRDHVADVRLVLSPGGGGPNRPLTGCRAIVRLRPFGTVPRAEAVDVDPCEAVETAVAQMRRDVDFELDLRRAFRFSERFLARA